MRVAISSFFANDVSAFTQGLADLDARIDPGIEAGKDGLFRDLTEAIWRSRDACRRVESVLDAERPLLKEVQTRFRNEIAPWFDRSWFMRRARTKPRGYPGDYELLAAVYDGMPRSRGFGGYLDLYFLNTTLGQAVRARLNAARRFLIGEVSRRRGDVSILNVACGPCREYAGGIDHPEECNIRITCVDSDRQALEYVKAHIMTVTPGIPNMNCECYNALRMSSAKANIKRFGRCDIIYSVGLCDYIPDKYLVSMLRGWRETLNPGGVLYVAFKDARRYDQTEYQWHVDWYFFQRTEEECRELFEQAGFDMNAMETSRDDTGVIINFISRAKVRTYVRMDVPRTEAPGRPRLVTSPLREDAGERRVRPGGRQQEQAGLPRD